MTNSFLFYLAFIAFWKRALHIYIYIYIYIYVHHNNSRRDWDGNVHDNVNVFGLGRIDLLHCCGRSSIEACYCQYIHNMLLWACTKHWCCTYNIHEITPPPSVHESPHSRSIQVELGKVEGFWNALPNCYSKKKKASYLNIEQWAHWLLIQEKPNQLCHVIMMSLGQIELDRTAPTRVSCQNSVHIYFLYHIALHYIIRIVKS